MERPSRKGRPFAYPGLSTVIPVRAGISFFLLRLKASRFQLSLEWRFLLAQGFDQAFEQALAVGAAVRGFHRALGMGHHAEYVATLIDDAGDTPRRAVD